MSINKYIYNKYKSMNTIKKYNINKKNVLSMYDSDSDNESKEEIKPDYEDDINNNYIIVDNKSNKSNIKSTLSHNLMNQMIYEAYVEDEEEIKENVNEVELSAEVAEPVKHNPEASNEPNFTLNKTNYPKTLQSRIYEKLNN